MKTKKLATLAMAGALCFSLAAPAFAGGTSTEITAKYSEIQIDVTVPATAKAVINPYSMPVSVKADDGTTEKGVLSTAGQVASDPMLLVNGTELNLLVGASVTTTSSGVELATTAIKSTSTEKMAQVYLEVKQDKTISTVKTGDEAIGGYEAGEVLDAFNAWAASTYAKTNTNQVICSTDATTTGSKMAVMGPSGAAGNIVLARLGGTVAQNPDTAWADTDTVTVNVAWSFTPATYTEVKDGSITSTTDLTNLSAGDNFTATYNLPAETTLSDDATYAWSSSATGVVAVKDDNDALATPTLVVKGTGSATITVVVTDGLTKYTASLDITIS